MDLSGVTTVRPGVAEELQRGGSIVPKTNDAAKSDAVFGVAEGDG
jgi:hypothetical protein